MATDIPAEVVEFMTQSARDHVLQMLREPALVTALVEPRIQQLIAAGDLVPRSRLQLGVGLELGPVGLEQAARALVAAAGEIKMPEIEGFSEALALLVRILNRVEAPAVPEPTSSDEEDDELEAKAADEPAADAPQCKVCGEVVDEEQKLTSWTRWREILCKEHHAVYDPKKSIDSYKPKAPRKKAS